MQSLFCHLPVLWRIWNFSRRFLRAGGILNSLSKRCIRLNKIKNKKFPFFLLCSASAFAGAKTYGKKGGGCLYKTINIKLYA